MSFIFVIDGGTTNLRIYLLNAAHEVMDLYRDDAGVRFTAIDGNNARLQASVKQGISELMERHGVQPSDVLYCAAFGMITSNVGLYELPHLAAPASVGDFHRGMAEVSMPEIAPFPIRFIPGLRNFGGAVDYDNASAMDMMRGEETETIGLYAMLEEKRDRMLVLPGSHNKFIPLDHTGTIGGCTTTISGELLDALTHHTILSSSVQGGFVTAEGYDREAMLRGAQAGRGGLGHAAFTARILQTLGKRPVEEVRSFLLGVVLQTDLMALRSDPKWHEGQKLCIAGKPVLAAALRDLFEANGMEAEVLPKEISEMMGVRGACTIAEYEG